MYLATNLHGGVKIIQRKRRGQIIIIHSAAQGATAAFTHTSFIANVATTVVVTRMGSYQFKFLLYCATYCDIPRSSEVTATSRVSSVIR